MKCPKCGYLGFEAVDRCRNCGYEFALASPPDALELPLNREAESRQPIDELSFLDAATLAPEPARTAAPVSARTRAGADLPLFGEPLPDDVPLITRPSPPRQPLAVRRATADTQRIRSAATRTPSLDLALEPPPRSTPIIVTPPAGDDAATSDAGEDAPIAARLAAVLTDLLVLAAIDAAVLYFTLQVCGIGIQDLGILPRGPLAAFFIVQNGGYLVAFTAGGQTLGKMVAGIRVVAADPADSLNFSRAFLREIVWCALALPAGLGLLTVFGRDHRGVHDRFAGTRVVRG
jgi:uncharacterized RDD family membrane protein YckC